jgi:DNA-binding response OmpR family regulator
LRARLRALVRRNAVNAELLSYGDLVLDLAAARVTRGRREVPLTRTEYGLLELFLRNVRDGKGGLVQGQRRKRAAPR